MKISVLRIEVSGGFCSIPHKVEIRYLSAQGDSYAGNLTCLRVSMDDRLERTGGHSRDSIRRAHSMRLQPAAQLSCESALQIGLAVWTATHRLPPSAHPRVLIVEHERHAESTL